jgi:hypothetical protein
LVSNRSWVIPHPSLSCGAGGANKQPSIAASDLSETADTSIRYLAASQLGRPARASSSSTAGPRTHVEGDRVVALVTPGNSTTRLHNSRPDSPDCTCQRQLDNAEAEQPAESVPLDQASDEGEPSADLRRTAEWDRDAGVVVLRYG